jgi:hypothetical protein
LTLLDAVNSRVNKLVQKGIIKIIQEKIFITDQPALEGFTAI